VSVREKLAELWDRLKGKGPAAAVAVSLDLGEARENKPYHLEAGGLIVETCDGDLYARINGPNGDGINLRYVTRIFYPFTSLFLTNESQPAKTARLLLLPVGMEADCPTSPARYPLAVLIDGSRKMTGPLCPATPGLSLGEDPYLWDGSALKNITRMTLGGSNDVTVWDYLGYYSYAGIPTVCAVRFPSGKMFKLWALGLGPCAFPGQSNIRAYDEYAGTTLKELGFAVYYDFYPTPYYIDGPGQVSLWGFQSGNPGLSTVTGYMVFSIE